MAGERLSGREPSGYYRDLPRLPGWEEVMAQPSPTQRFELMLAALVGASQQRPVNPLWLDPVGLADWVDRPAAERTWEQASLSATGEVINFGSEGQLLTRHKRQFDNYRKLASLIEASYSNYGPDALQTADPVSVRYYSWIYNNRLSGQPLVKSTYSEYSRITSWATEQTVSTYWFFPPRIVAQKEFDLMQSRLQPDYEITAKYCGQNLMFLSARILDSNPNCQPGLGAQPVVARQLQAEFSAGEVVSAELVDNQPAAGKKMTLAISRTFDGQLIEGAQQPPGLAIRPKVNQN